MNPTRRQIFAGKPDSTFYNIWDLLILAFLPLFKILSSCVWFWIMNLVLVINQVFGWYFVEINYLFTQLIFLQSTQLPYRNRVLGFSFWWDESTLESWTPIGLNKCTAPNPTYLVVSKRILVAVPKSQSGHESTHCFDWSKGNSPHGLWFIFDPPPHLPKCSGGNPSLTCRLLIMLLLGLPPT